MTKGASDKDMVTLVFKSNRRKELYVGGNMFVFEPYGVMKVARSVVDHPDFKGQSDQFIVKGY